MIDIAVVGGGVNGLAIAREAAGRGLTVTVLERDEIGHGATGASSHLIHGGLKYLENLDIDLVRESIRERRLLLRNAPHLVTDYPMLIPFQRGARRSRVLVRWGLVVHDLLSRAGSGSRSRGLSAQQVIDLAPGIAAGGLLGGALFHDGQVVWPQRLCVELMLDAERMGAQVLSRSPVMGFLTEGDRVTGVSYRDESGTSRSLAARVTLNVTGPWIDKTLGPLGAFKLSGGTKGSHLVVGRFDGAPRVGVFFEAAQDGRPVFVLPWNDRYLIGSTDLTFDGDLDDVRIDADEIAYLLAEANRIFPGAHLSARDVHYAYSGVRPLPHVGSVASNSTISRGHSIVNHAPAHPGLMTVVGGKLTTHRALAEDAVDSVVRELGLPRQPSPTRSRPLPGAAVEDWKSFAEDFLRHAQLPERTAASLLQLYGVRARRIVDLMDTASIQHLTALDTRLLAAEVTLAVQEERATTLSSVLLGRLPHRVGTARDERTVALAAATMASLLGWDAERTGAEVWQFHARLAHRRTLPEDLPVPGAGA